MINYQMSIENFIDACEKERDRAINEHHSIIVSANYDDYSYFTITIDPSDLYVDEKNIRINKDSFLMELNLCNADLFNVNDNVFGLENSFYIIYNKKDSYTLFNLQNDYDIAIDFV